MPFKPREVVQKLKAAGFEEIRQTGSHLILAHADGRRTFVAMHAKTMPTGTFRKILKQAGLTEAEFREL